MWYRQQQQGVLRTEGQGEGPGEGQGSESVGAAAKGFPGGAAVLAEKPVQPTASGRSPGRSTLTSLCSPRQPSAKTPAHGIPPEARGRVAKDAVRSAGPARVQGTGLDGITTASSTAPRFGLRTLSSLSVFQVK